MWTPSQSQKSYTVQKDFDEGDEERTAKTILTRFAIGITLAMTTLWLAVILPKLCSQGGAPYDPWIRQVYLTIAIFSLISVSLLAVLYAHTIGLTTWCKFIVIAWAFGVMTVGWISDMEPYLLSFNIAILDLCFALETTVDAEMMKRLAYVDLWLFIACVTLDCIDQEFEVGLHPHGRPSCKSEGSLCYSAPYKWVLIVFPCVINFFLMRKYVASAREHECRALKAAETAFKIADLLAHYDLVAAEKLLDKDVLSGSAGHIHDPLSRLCSNLRAYMVFLPDALFRVEETTMHDSDVPNEELSIMMTGKESSSDHIHSAIDHMLDPNYSLKDFHDDMVVVYPELQLYLHQEAVPRNTSRKSFITTSGRTVTEEYERTLSAMYAVYCLLRLDLDGKEIFSYGINADGSPLTEPVGDDADKKMKFYQLVPWGSVVDLLRRADVVQLDEWGKIVLRRDRVIALLSLTAIHDIMKNSHFLPTVCPKHAPYRGYNAFEQIGDHDIALEYILENYPTVLPAFRKLEAGQRAPILFSQGKMGFNNGWLVQGEAPPGALFSRFKKVITEGRASQADINFYFLHWFTDLAGAEPFQGKPWPGCEKFTVKFPIKVLAAFLDSFGFVDRLAYCSEVQTMEEYLVGRWSKLGLHPGLPSHSEVAVMRLTLMAQGFETSVVNAFGQLPQDDFVVLTEELARTGCKENFSRAPDRMAKSALGPALLVYYAPALLQKAGAENCYEAMCILAAVFRAARMLFPLEANRAEETVTIRIDVLKVLHPRQIVSKAPWHLLRTSGTDAEASEGSATNGNSAPIQLRYLLL